MALTITELKARRAKGELSEAELNAVLATKKQSKAIRRELGKLLTGCQRTLKGRTRRKPPVTIPEYKGLTGEWARYYEVTSRYEGKIPTQDRDDWRHNTMLELERAEKRDGQPLPPLRAYRIASLMVALYFRELHRYSTRVCILNGYPVEPHCKACKSRTEGKRCAWLAIRPVERLDGEVLDAEGYSVRLLDTVASDRIQDMPDKWYDLKKLAEALPPRLAEIAYKKLEGKRLSEADRKYLYRFRKSDQKSLF
jgi:hypothetical protein